MRRAPALLIALAVAGCGSAGETETKSGPEPKGGVDVRPDGPPKQGVFDPLTGRDETGAYTDEVWRRYDAAREEITSLAIEDVKGGAALADALATLEERFGVAQEDCANAQKRPPEAFAERFAKDLAEARVRVEEASR